MDFCEESHIVIESILATYESARGLVVPYIRITLVIDVM
jgi:hypothetical protein